METIALVRVLVDTSVWIAFFRKQEPYHSTLTRLIDNEQVSCIGVILAELMQGAKSEKELAVLNDFTSVFSFVPETPELWAEAGRLSFRLRRKGITVGLADCFIATAVTQTGHQLASLDAHFDLLGQTVRLTRYQFPPLSSIS